VEVCSDTEKIIAALEVKVRSAEAHSINVATAGKNQLSDFETRLVLRPGGLAQAVCAQHSTHWWLKPADGRGGVLSQKLPPLAVRGDIWSP
jgi:hypothetical protein